MCTSHDWHDRLMTLYSNNLNRLLAIAECEKTTATLIGLLCPGFGSESFGEKIDFFREGWMKLEKCISSSFFRKKLKKMEESGRNCMKKYM